MEWEEGDEGVSGFYDQRVFPDRLSAAKLLVKRLGEYRGRNPLVLGIPRGAVPMAGVIADELGGELDVVLVHKLGAPFQPEYAIGGVSESGDVYVSDAAELHGIEKSYIQREAAQQIARLRRRRETYTPVRPPIDVAGRVVIIVDDGVATGSTMLAALRAVRLRKPAKLVAAVAVAPPDAVARMREAADDVVCLETPYPFFAVGKFFADFREVTDDDVIAVLARRGADVREPQTR